MRIIQTKISLVILLVAASTTIAQNAQQANNLSQISHPARYASYFATDSFDGDQAATNKAAEDLVAGFNFARLRERFDLFGGLKAGNRANDDDQKKVGTVSETSQSSGHLELSCQAQCNRCAWNGMYVGGNFGHGWADASNVNTNGGFWGVPPPTPIRSNGLSGGIQTGFWRQTDRGVYGLDTSYTWSNMNGNVASPVFPVNDTWTAAIDGILLVQGRFGTTKDAWLMFVQGGYAGVDSQLSGDSLVGPTTATDTEWHNGWTVGFGVHKKIGCRYSLGFEYNYVDATSERFGWSVAGGETADADHQIHQLKLTGNIHF